MIEPHSKAKRDVSRFDHERTARQAVKLTAGKLSKWQVEVSRLRGLANYHPSSEAKASLLDACEAMTDEIEEEKKTLL